MLETRIDEPLAWLEARFERGTVAPTAFRWRHRDYQVASVNARWVDRAARPVRRGYSVTTRTGEVMELCWREDDPVWRLAVVST